MASKVPLPVSDYANNAEPVRAMVAVATQTNLSATEGSGTYVVVYTAIQPTIIDHLDIGYDGVSGDGAVWASAWKVPSTDVITDAEDNTRLQTLTSGALADKLVLASTTPTYGSFDFTGVPESTRTLARGERLVVILYGSSGDNDDITLPVISMLGRTNRL